MENRVIYNIIKCKECLLSERSFSLIVSKEFIIPTVEFEKFCEMMRKEGFSDDQIMSTITELECRLNSEVADYIRTLMKKHDITAYKIHELCGLSDRYINAVIRENKSISKEYVFGLCLFFELTKNEVEEFLRIRGVTLDNSVPDKMFKTFVDNGHHGLLTYVIACERLAEATGIKLPEFFGLKGYSDKTISCK